MYSCRPVMAKDYLLICSFPVDDEEVFFISPKLRPPLTADQFRDAAKERLLPTVLVFDRNQVCGYCNLYNLEEGRSVWLGNVIVSPPFRGTDAAGFLVRHMMTAAKEELQVKELHLVCYNTNTRGLLFYSKLGFKPYDVSKRMNLQGQTIGGLHMKIEL